MPSLTIPVGRGKPPIVPFLFATTEAWADALRDAGEPVPLPILAYALLDTGASETFITRDLAEGVGSEPGGERSVYGLGVEPAIGTVYRVRIFFGSGLATELSSSVSAIAVASPQQFGVEALIGRDLLSRCLLFYNGPVSTCTFAF